MPLDIRVLATSNRDMAQEVREGGFREDLYYRLNVFPLQIPALRERPGDIVPLARHFLALHGGRMLRPARLAADAEAILAGHAWPGNVRQLENIMQRALILAPSEMIETEHLMFAATVPLTVAMEAPQLFAETTDNPASMKDLERQHILDTLAAVGGSRIKAVEKLGISERTLRYKLKQYRDEGLL